jgi:hypothetical protein
MMPDIWPGFVENIFAIMLPVGGLIFVVNPLLGYYRRSGSQPPRNSQCHLACQRLR